MYDCLPSRCKTAFLLLYLVACLAGSLSILPSPLWAQNSDMVSSANERRLKELQEGLEKGKAEKKALNDKSAALESELASLQRELVKLAGTAQQNETILSELEAKLKTLAVQEKQKSTILEGQSQQMLKAMMALQRLSWRPLGLGLADLGSSNETVRGAIVLRATVEDFRRSAQELTREVANLSSLRRDIDSQKNNLETINSELLNQNKTIKTLIEQKNILIEETRGKLKNNDKNLDALAQEAKTLKELMTSIEINRKKVSKLEQEMGLNKPSEAQKSQKNSLSSVSQSLLLPFSRAKGRVFSPAAGDTVTGFGEAVENSDGLSKGIYIAARGKAQVVAPYSGMVAYAGDFRGYGLLLIIDHGEGYHSVLSGMRRLLTSVGQHVLAGEPIAVMNDTGGKPPLYFELRQNGQPVNPLPWLMAR